MLFSQSLTDTMVRYGVLGEGDPLKRGVSVTASRGIRHDPQWRKNHKRRWPNNLAAGREPPKTSTRERSPKIMKMEGLWYSQDRNMV